VIIPKDQNKAWYAVYTRSRCEKKVFSRLEEMHVESFLPLKKTIRQWSDRKKKIEMPLLTSYVFVKVGPKEFHKVMLVDGTVRFVTFENKAASIPQKQINNLILLSSTDFEIESTRKKFDPGEHVVVKEGPLTGLAGELVFYGYRKRFLVRIDHISQNLLVNIPAAMLVHDN
jgi:transcription antitermination factor NusG